MSSNPVILQVNDGIAPSIAPNLKAIETNARSADASVQALKQSLDAITASGVGNLSKSLSVSANSTAKLATATANMGASALTASQNVDRLSISYTGLSSALTRVIGLISTYGNSLANANRSGVPFVQTVKQAGANAHGAVTDVMAASAAIRGLEGNFGTSVRAGERFLVNVLGLGPVLRAAFPLFGALAFLGILDILGTHIGNLIDVFKRLKGEITDTEIAAIKAGEKILSIKAPSFFSATNFAKIISGDFSANKPIEIKNAQTTLKDIQYQKDLASAQEEVNEKGLQGLALVKAKENATKRDIEFSEKAKEAALELAKGYETLLTAQHKTGDAFVNRGGTITPAQFARNIVDPKQIKEIEDQMRTAQEAAKAFGHEADVLRIRIVGIGKGEGIAAMKDELKAAHEQAKLFEVELGKLKQGDHVITPQEKLSVLQGQLRRALPENVPALENQIGSTNQEIERQKDLIASIVGKLQEENDAIGTYSDQLREGNAYQKIDSQLRKDHITLTADQIAHIKELIKTNVEEIDYQRELRSAYEQFDGPARKWSATIRAIQKLEHDGAISHEQALIATNEASKGYNDAVKPLNEYAHGLENEIALLGKYGQELQVATQIQQVQDQLRQKGRSLNDFETVFLTKYLRMLSDQKTIQSEINKLYEQYGGRLVQIGLSEAALVQARQKGIITAEQEGVALAKLKVETAQLSVEMQKGTGKDLATAVFGNYIKNFEGFTKSTTKLYQQMFTSIADGAADALGRAIAFGEDLGDALKQVARQALSELIAGFIKVGIQMLLTKLIGSAASTAAVTQAAIDGTAVASAWAPAAAMVSLATLGANAAPADTALISTVTLADMLSLAHFNTGGPVPGIGNTDTVPIMATPGEYILNKRAVQSIGLEALNAMNASGASALRNRSSASSVVGGVSLNISVEHDGSTGVSVQQIDEGTIRIIAKQEADKAVNDRAPEVVAAHISNPNSRVSKNLVRYNSVGRRRN